MKTFKFLGTHVSNDLTWNTNCTAILKKARQRLYFLRQLKTYHVNTSVLTQFYRAIIESVLSYSITTWFDRATQSDLQKLSSVIRQAEKIIGERLPTLEDIYLQRLTKKTGQIMKDCFHLAYKYFEFLPSGRRLRHFKGSPRFLNSTYPQAVKFYNNLRKSRL